VAAAGSAAGPALTARAGLPAGLLVAIAVCAFTAAGNDRFTAAGSGSGGPAKRTWPGCALRGIDHRPYRAPDEKTIRVVGTASAAGALARPARRPSRQLPGCGGPSSASVRGYRARRAAGQAKALARGRLRAVAVDGKTSRGARRADGTRVHLLGVAVHAAGCWIT